MEIGSNELYEYALERLTFLEKYKLLNDILKIKYSNLTPKQKIYRNYFKNIFIYEIDGEPILFSNIMEDTEEEKMYKNGILSEPPIGFYLFNNK